MKMKLKTMQNNDDNPYSSTCMSPHVQHKTILRFQSNKRRPYFPHNELVEVRKTRQTSNLRKRSTTAIYHFRGARTKNKNDIPQQKLRTVT